MKTEEQVRAKITECESKIDKLRKDYENHQDIIIEYLNKIVALKWVLSNY